MKGRSALTGERMVPVLYLDIDGTVREGKDDALGRFVNGPEDVRVFEGVPELLWRYKHRGWRIIGVSNQGGIALGYLAGEVCAEAMLETQRQTSLPSTATGAFDKIGWCRHHPDAAEPEMARCWCRKPRPGLAIECAISLAEIHRGEIYPPYLALFVGDREEDRLCAEALNVTFMDAAEWRAGGHDLGTEREDGPDG